MIRLLFGIQLLSMGAMEMSGPFWPLRLKELAPNEFVFGLVGVGVYVAPMLGIAFTGALWGRLGDRHGHRAMMVRALVGLALTQLALAFAADVWTIVLLRFVQGACAGFPAPAQAYGISMVPADRRGRLFAFLQASTNGGSLLGAVAGGAILDHSSFFWINAGAAGLCALCALAVLTVLPGRRSEPPDPVTKGARSAAGTWRNPAISNLLVAVGVLLASRLMPQMPFSLYVHSTFHVENWVIGLCYGLMAIGFIASASLWARIFERLGRAQALGLIAGVAAACAVIVLIVAVTAHITIFASAYFAWGALLGATTPVITTLISRASQDEDQGHILGIVQSVTQGSSVAGIALGGIINQTAGPSAVFPSVAFMYVVSGLILLRSRRLAVGSGCNRIEGRMI